jgi:hypothetical protein
MPATQQLLEKITELNSEQNEKLAEVKEMCNEAKAKLDDKGESMSDMKVVVEMKKQIKKITEENVFMEVRVGVVMATLWGGNAAAAEDKVAIDLEGSIGSNEPAFDPDNDSLTGGGDSITHGGSSVASVGTGSVVSGITTTKFC